MLGVHQVHGDRAYRALAHVSTAPRVIGPIWQLPLWLILLARLLGLLARLLIAALRHPLVTGFVVGSGWLIAQYGRDGYTFTWAVLAAVIGVWVLVHRQSWLRLVGWPLLSRLRRLWVYQRHWDAAMATCGLTAMFGDRGYLPKLGRVRCDRYTDRVRVHLVSGQAPEDWEKVTAPLAHTLGALSCVVRVVKPRLLVLEFLRADPLIQPVPALPIPKTTDLTAVALGVVADGSLWLCRLLGTHILVAGATGAGKGSVLWSLIRGLATAIRDGLVALWVLDPKGGMELASGEPMFARFVYGDDDNPDPLAAYQEMAAVLDEAVRVMKARQARLRGTTRLHTPTSAEPLIVVMVDEMAGLSAYCQDSQLRKRMGQALSLLLSQGRAVGVLVVGALQDPRKEVLPFRDLFPTRIALRLTEPSQVDMVLGDGARNRGALCDQIPETLPGVGYVALDGVREPKRVRAAYVTDDDIAAMARDYPSPHRHTSRPTPADQPGEESAA
jgi:S-DNA-T family DNA segregation ATPase FtsK/SpoIIIE